MVEYNQQQGYVISSAVILKFIGKEVLMITVASKMVPGCFINIYLALYIQFSLVQLNSESQDELSGFHSFSKILLLLTNLHFKKEKKNQQQHFVSMRVYKKMAFLVTITTELLQGIFFISWHNDFRSHTVSFCIRQFQCLKGWCHLSLSAWSFLCVF